jgi:hypothetical protein
MTRERALYKFKVEKTGDEHGAYLEPPVATPPTERGARKVYNIADPCGPGEDVSTENPQRGPALSTLPVTADPSASSFLTCYLLNVKNLTYRTPWTMEEWNDSPNSKDEAYEDIPTPSSFSLVVGAPDGSAFLIRKDGSEFKVEEVPLQYESEVWNQLRNGCVAGSVRLTNGNIVPLVNVASLMPSAKGG